MNIAWWDKITITLINWREIECEIIKLYFITTDTNRIACISRRWNPTEWAFLDKIWIGLYDRFDIAEACWWFIWIRRSSTSPYFEREKELLLFLSYIQSHYRHIISYISVWIWKMPLPIISRATEEQISKLAHELYKKRQSNKPTNKQQDILVEQTPIETKEEIEEETKEEIEEETKEEIEDKQKESSVVLSISLWSIQPIVVEEPNIHLL